MRHESGEMEMQAVMQTAARMCAAARTAPKGLGAEKKLRGVPHCGYCGHENCAGCQAAGSNCSLAYVDLGVAVSSAVTIAAADRIDNRIMYSIGKAAVEMDFSSDVLWLGIPLSVSGKNIFFDRGIFHK